MLEQRRIWFARVGPLFSETQQPEPPMFSPS